MKEILENKIKPKKTKRFIKIILLLISYLIVAIIVWKMTISIQSSPKYQQQQVQKQIESIVKKVGKLVLLPQSETPEIVIIQNVDELKKNQDFFSDAQNGDKILVYTQARKAIIYRESTNKIINIVLNVGADNTDVKQTKESDKLDTNTSTTTNTEKTQKEE